MLENIWTEYLKEQLADRLRGYSPPTQSYLALPNKWIAMSLLQKAIRRRDEAQALRAGCYLLSIDYRTLWRRLVVIAWEDISFGDFDLCGMVTAASGSKRWRAKLGGEWRVVSYLISALCQAQKNRVADDLITIVEHESSLEDIRDNLGTTKITDLSSIVSNQATDLTHRLIAMWYMLGTTKFESDVLYRRSGDINLFFETFETSLCPEHVLAVCRVAVARSGTILPAVIPLLWSRWRDVIEPTLSRHDDLKPHSELNSIPRYALDGNTRIGRRYLYGLAERSPELKRYLHEAVSFADRKALLRKLYFRSYSSLCHNRQVWDISDKIRTHADQIGFGPDAQTINTGKRILEAAIRSYPMTEIDL